MNLKQEFLRHVRNEANVFCRITGLSGFSRYFPQKILILFIENYNWESSTRSRGGRGGSHVCDHCAGMCASAAAVALFPASAVGAERSDAGPDVGVLRSQSHGLGRTTQGNFTQIYFAAD